MVNLLTLNKFDKLRPVSDNFFLCSA